MSSGFDEVLEKLRDVVARLEQGNLSLEDSLKAYEEGISLARAGHELLDKAEKRVELLVAGGKIKRVDVEADPPADDRDRERSS